MLSIEEKSRLISQVSHIFGDMPLLSEFFAYNDVGVPLAQCVNYGLCELTQDGEEAINETWDFLCNVSNADKNKDYENADEILMELIADTEDEE
jgi:hypothetical protein